MHGTRRVLWLTSAVVLVDTLFFAALTPLLPHYAHTLGLGKGGAGLLAAAYPLGALVGAIPSGIVAARLGVKPTVLVGLLVVAATTVLFGLAETTWQLDAARFAQGLASAFSWTGALAWLVAESPAARRGSLIGQAFAAAIAGALLGPVLGGIASVAGARETFAAVAAVELVLAVWAIRTPSTRPAEPQPFAMLLQACLDRRVLLSMWLVVLPALLFGTLVVLAPLRLSTLGYGSIAIGAIWLVAGALESLNNLAIGRLADRRGPLVPVRLGLLCAAIGCILLPLPGRPFVLAVVVVFAALSFGSFYTPGMTILTHAAEARGLDYGYAFALINIAWAPGQSGGSAVGGALAQVTSDTAVYLALCAISLLTLAGLWRSRSSS
jgi:predicted MFS family arabinose efflux permease